MSWSFTSTHTVPESTGVPLKTIKNVLTGLRKQGVDENTGETKEQAE